MIVETFRLAAHDPRLAQNGADPKVTMYLQEDIEESDCKGMLRVTPRPSLVICPGGGYRHVGKREGEPIALAFMPLGFNCFILDYSVVPHTYPQALLEISSLIELMYQNAEKWNLDTEKIVLCGFSAGGHLVGSYCTMRNRPEIQEAYPLRSVAGAILGYSVVTADPAVGHVGSFGNLTGHTLESAAEINRFSLDTNVDKSITPPTFIWHSFTDRTVSVLNSLAYGAAMKKADIPFEMHIFPSGRHGLGTADRQCVHDHREAENQYVSQWIPLAQGWLKEYIL